MEKLRNTTDAVCSENIIVIDWLSVTFFDVTPDHIKALLGLNTQDIDWRDELCYRNGYPRQISFSNIAIRYGADKVENWTTDEKKSADDKVRFDMGIQLDMSGNGCRAFESYGHSDWIKLLSDICALGKGAQFTRIDLSYDDRDGILPMQRIMCDTEDEYWTGAPSKWMTYRSGDQRNKLKGKTAYIGSKSSQVYLRIYDKAAEREFSEDDNVHWIRVELVLRHDRSNAAVQEILQRNDVGEVLCGVLKNYCCFREPSNDSNKSRWPVAEYWEKLLNGVQRIRLFSAPGEAYNFKKTEEFMIAQWGQAIQTFYEIHKSMIDLLSMCRKAHPQLKPKYQKAIEEMKLQAKMEQQKRDLIRKELALSYDENFPIIDGQIDIADIFPINDNPGAAGPRYKIPNNN